MAERSLHLVVVGGNGFVGSHFVAAAVDVGHRITVVGRRPRPVFEHGRPFDFLGGGIAALIAAPDLLDNADCVCHFATTTTPASSNADPAADIETNLVPVVRLLEAMRRWGNRRILYLSSGGAVYGRPQTLPIPEDHRLAPVSSYGVVKASIEQYLRLFETTEDFHATIIRLANPYGPGQASGGSLGAVNTFIDRAIRGQPVQIWGDGSTIRDFIYISDVIKLLLATLTSDAGGTFNCGAGTGTSLIELVGLVANTIGRSLAHQLHPPRRFDPPAVILDISRANRTFQWQPTVSLPEGIGITAAEVRRNSQPLL